VSKSSSTHGARLQRIFRIPLAPRAGQMTAEGTSASTTHRGENAMRQFGLRPSSDSKHCEKIDLFFPLFLFFLYL
jgi:hypothetical protein